MHIYVCVYICICMYMYTYIYDREIGRQRDGRTREIGIQASEIGEKATLGERGVKRQDGVGERQRKTGTER